MTTTLTPPPAPAAQPEALPLTLRVYRAFQLTDDEFFAFCAQNRDLRIEQTKEGDSIIMPPTGFETGSRNNELSRQLGNWAALDGTGVAVDSSTGFTLPNGAKRSPDAAWVRRDRLAALTPEQKRTFLPLAPDFAAELRSPSDPLPPIQEKMAEYTENGTRLGWLLDTQGRRAHAYRPNTPGQVLEASPALSGDPELPGLTLDLSPIWTLDL